MIRPALLAGILVLAAPAAAPAATLVVGPDQAYKTIGSAISAAAPGDTVEIRKGTYPESPTVDRRLLIKGAGPGDVKVTGSGTGDVFTLQAADTELSGLTVEVPAGAGSAVAVEALGAKLSSLVAQRANPSEVDDPVIDVASGGGAEIAHGFVIQGAGTATAGIRKAGDGALSVVDSLVLSATGPGIALSGGQANRVVRSTVASTTQAPGLAFTASSAGDKKAVLDSSYLVGGTAGLAVTTTGSATGAVSVDGRHVTVYGPKGAVLDASGAEGNLLTGASGDITATFTSSIVHGASETKEFAGLPLVSAPNSVKLSFSASDAPAATGNGEITQAAQFTEDAKLFAPKSLKLRADAPVIDRGAAPAADESTKDVEGEARVNGAASDMGADEFHNRAPVARFGIANPSAKQNTDVGFISGSTDPEQDVGGGITEYRWNFGDGTTQTTPHLGVVHRYADPGTYQVTLQVVDRQGGVSEVSAPQTVTVTDGIAPTLAIGVPVNGQRVKLTRSGKRKPLPLTVLGSWADPSGIGAVEVSLRVVKRDKVKKAKKRKARKRSRAKRSARTCEFYSGRLLARKPCDKPIWVKAIVQGKGFALVTRKGLKLPPGRYQLRVRGTDAAGNLAEAFSTNAKTQVDFRIK